MIQVVAREPLQQTTVRGTKESLHGRDLRETVNARLLSLQGGQQSHPTDFRRPTCEKRCCSQLSTEASMTIWTRSV